MTQLVGAILLLALTLSVESINVLVFGDSVDRFAISDWCMAVTGHLPISWASPQYFLHNPHSPGLNCIAPKYNASIAYLHIYGSSAGGPYYNQRGIDMNGNLVNTSDRIRVGLAQYYSNQFPTPDIVFLNTILWDGYYLLEYGVFNETQLDELSSVGSPLWTTTLRSFQHNLLNRLQDLRQLLPPSTLLALSTTMFPPWMRGSDPKICEISHHREFFLGLNTAVRDLYHTYQQLQDGVKSFPLLFYDFDDDSWSTYHYNYTRCRSLFRDVTHHPAASLLRNRVDKMLGLVYSNRFFYRHSQRSSATHDTQASSLWPRLHRPTVFQELFHRPPHPQEILPEKPPQQLWEAVWSKLNPKARLRKHKKPELFVQAGPLFAECDNCTGVVLNVCFGRPFQRIKIVRELQHRHQYSAISVRENAPFYQALANSFPSAWPKHGALAVNSTTNEMPRRSIKIASDDWQAQHTYFLLYEDMEVERGHDGMDDEHKACQIIEKLRLSVYNNITRSVMQTLSLGDADVYFANETEMNVLPPFTAWEGP